MENATPCKENLFFNEDTLLFTPLPQATSTVDRRPNLLPHTDIIMEQKEPPDVRSTYLSDGLTAINELRQKLDSLKLAKISDIKNTGIDTIDLPNDQAIISNSDCKLSLPVCYDLKSKLSTNEMNSDRILTSMTSLSAKQAMADITNISNSSVQPENILMALNGSNMNEFFMPAFKVGNVSLPAGVCNTSVDSIANSSLPVKGNHQTPIGQDLSSFLPSSFNPLHQVSDHIKRNTYTLDALDADESERNRIREKALQIIGSFDPPGKGSSAHSRSSLQQKSFDNMTPAKDDVSGFSNLMNKSDFQKDESWCAHNFGLPIKAGEESMSFLSASQVSLDFMPPDDSLFRELGPADPPKYRDVTENSEANFSSVSCSNADSKIKEADKNSNYDPRIRESSKDVKDLFSELDSSVASSFMTGRVTDYLKNSIPPGGRSTPEGYLTPRNEESLEGVIRVSEIAKALENVPLDATPNSLAKKVMELSEKTSSVDRSLRVFRGSEQFYYERTVVYGGIAHIEIPAENSTPQTLWSFVDLDINQVKAVLKSDQSPVKVLMFPFVRKNIVVKVQEVDFDRDDTYFTRLHVIKLIVEQPQVEIVGATELDFGLVPECGLVKHPVTIRSKNSNVIIICPKFEQEELSPFKILLDEEFDEEIHLAPYQDLQVKVIISPTTGFCADPQRMIHITDKLKLCLSSMLGNETLFQLPLKASVFVSRLLIQMNNVEKPIAVGEERQVLIKNTSPCSVNINITTKGQFHSSIPRLVMKPNEIAGVKVTFILLQDKDLLDGELLLTVMPGNLDYFIKLKGILNDNSYSFSASRDVQSRCSSSSGSVNCTMNSSSEPDGPLQMECTSAYLVWPSIALAGTSTVKSCFIRSKGMFREKLLIEINDPSNSFYLVTNERERKKNEIVVLNSHEKKQITVEFSPKLLGQLKAQVLIKRARSKYNDDCKQVILYGYGGCANLRAHNIAMDLENRQFTLSLQENFSQQFTLQNWGDGIAFFSLSQKKLEGMHLEVSPVRGLIGPGEVRNITLTLQADSSGSQSALFNKFLSRDKSSDVVLSSLTITYGDESTRLRLARLFRKHKNQPQLKKSPQVTSALKAISELFPVNKQKMECVSLLKDPLISLSDLFDEGIQELTIDVIARRKIIEDAKLDVTQQFVSFSEAIQLDETEYTTLFETTHPSHITFN